MLALTLVLPHPADVTAAAPGPPFAFTGIPAVTGLTACLRGTVVPNGAATGVRFMWGPVGGVMATTVVQSAGSGGEVIQVAAAPLAIQRWRSYHSQIMASNAQGVTVGAERLWGIGHDLVIWGDNRLGSNSNPPSMATGVVAVAAGSGHTLALRSDGRVVAWGLNDYGQADVPAGLSNVVAIAAGRVHSLAARADGTVVAWGEDSYGQIDVPSRLSNVVAVAGGLAHSLALLADGTVTGWGRNAEGQLNVPTSLTGAVAVGAGLDHSLALVADGTVVAWGGNGGAAQSVPAGLSNVVAISAGLMHCLALRADGTVVAWGANYSGQGNVPAGLSNVVDIVAGNSHSLALRADGRVFVWGDDGSGLTNIPTTLYNAIGLAAGWAHAVALIGNTAPLVPSQTATNAGNADAVITLGATDAEGDPMVLRIAALPGAGALYQYAGGVRGGLIATAGTAVADANGRVIFAPAMDAGGNPYASFRVVPSDGLQEFGTATVTLVIGLAEAITRPAVVVTEQSVTLRGEAVSRGLNTWTWFAWGTTIGYGQVTTPQDIGVVPGTTHTAVAAMLSGLQPNTPYRYALVASNAAGVVTGAEMTVWTSGPTLTYQADPFVAGGSRALKGSVLPGLQASSAWYEWGPDWTFGNTGAVQSTGPGGTLVRVSEPLGTIEAWRVYRSRLVGSNVLGMTRTPARPWGIGRRVFAWGYGVYAETNVPPNLTDIVAISNYERFSAALRADGSVVIWGMAPNTVGPTGVVAISFGNGYGLGLRANGTVTYWGSPPAGGPAAIASLNNIVAISAGNFAAMALRANGTVTAWGDNTFGQTSVPPGVSNIVAISCGPRHCLAVRVDGMVLAWGSNDHGMATVPPDLTNAVAVAAGNYQSLVLKADGTLATWGWNVAGLLSPPNVTNAVAIAAGFWHSAALRADGTVVVWGNSTAGQRAIPAGVERGVGLSAGGDQTMVLTCDRGPAAVSSAFAGNLNEDMTISLSGSDWEGDPLVFRITSLPSTGVLYQCAGGGRGALIASAGTQVADPAGRVIYAPPPDASGQPLAGLSYVAYDGWYESPTAGVSLAIGVATGRVVDAVDAPPLGAVLRGEVLAGGLPSVATFVWGPTTNYGFAAPTTPAGSAATFVPISMPIAGLASNTTYHCAVVASNASGVTRSGDFTFSTRPPVVRSEPVHFVGGTPRLRGSVATPLGGTKVWFEWGTEDAMPNASVAQDLGVSPRLVRFGRDLAPSLAWQSQRGRIVASNSYGLARGAVTPWGIGRRVLAWGLNTSGQTNVPDGLSSQAVAVAAGGAFAAALRVDGRVVAWGDNASGCTNVPDGLDQVVSVACGTQHVVALRSDGTAVAWGQSTSGQTNVPVGLDDLVAVAAGAIHNLALRDDGTLAGWGTNGSSGLITIPAGATNIVSMACGANHNVALSVEGNVFAWGNTTYGQTLIPAGTSNVVAIAAGLNHSLALRADGTVAAWGLNSWGQSSVPVGLTNVMAVAAGDNHSMAMLGDGSVVAWGQTNYGKTVIVPWLNSVVGMDAGAQFSVLLAANSRPVVSSQVIKAAANLDTAVTLFSVDAEADPLTLVVTELPGQGTLRQYVEGATGSVFTTNGTVVTDLSGRVVFSPAADTFGNPYAVFRYVADDGITPSPTASISFVVGAAEARTLAAVADAPAAVVLQGEAIARGLPTYAWFVWAVPGSNDRATATQYLGTGTNFMPVAAAVSGLVLGATYRYALVASNALGCATGTSRSFPVLRPYVFTESPVVAAGSGQLLSRVAPQGQATAAWFEWGPAGGDTATTAVQSAGAGTGVARVVQSGGSVDRGRSYRARAAAGSAFGTTYGARRLLGIGRQVMAWGATDYGITNPPAAASNIVAVYGGYQHALALRDDGRLVAWGRNDGTQCNVPSTLTNAIMAAGGYRHSVALRADGVVMAWGSNYLGTTNMPAGLTNVVAVAAGFDYSCALKADGTIVGWGENDFGQCYPPTGRVPAVAVAAGINHNLALWADGTVAAWGDGRAGQTNVPSGLTNVTAIAAGEYHSLALRADGRVVAWGSGSSGQTNVPPDLTNVVDIAAKRDFSLALTADGRVVAWGTNTAGPISAPSEAANVISIAAGGASGFLVQGDRAPRAQSLDVRGPPLQELVVALGGQDPDGDPLAWRIAARPPSGMLYQYEGDARGAAIDTNGAPVSDPQGRVVFAPAPPGYGAPCGVFVFSISDGVYESALATATVSIAGADARTLAPEDAGEQGAGLRGEALSLAPDGWAWFRWGASTNLAETTTLLAVAPGTNWVPVMRAVTNLSSNSVFHCALVVSNVSGLATGGLVSFATGPDTNRLMTFVPNAGMATLGYFGRPGQRIDAFASSNLTEWILLGPAVELPPGYYLFSDPSFTNERAGFYRFGSP